MYLLFSIIITKYLSLSYLKWFLKNPNSFIWLKKLRYFLYVFYVLLCYTCRHRFIFNLSELFCFRCDLMCTIQLSFALWSNLEVVFLLIGTLILFIYADIKDELLKIYLTINMFGLFLHNACSDNCKGFYWFNVFLLVVTFISLSLDGIHWFPFLSNDIKLEISCAFHHRNTCH